MNLARQLFGRGTRATHDNRVTREESFRVLRTNVRVAIADLENPVVLVTSSVQGEGKTSVCTALARSLASSGQRVVLVDMDLRRPDAHNRLQVPNSRGVSDVLSRGVDIADAMTFVNTDRSNGLYFLAAGHGVENPTELLSSPATGQLLTGLARQADIVLIDTPPALPVADTLVIGRLAAGALLVIETGRVPTPTVLRAKASLTRNQTRVLGVVLNRHDPAAGTYGYGYGYGPPTTTTDPATAAHPAR